MLLLFAYSCACLVGEHMLSGLGEIFRIPVVCAKCFQSIVLTAHLGIVKMTKQSATWCHLKNLLFVFTTIDINDINLCVKKQELMMPCQH